jgi:hypothetical protein
MNQTNSNQISHLISLKWTFIFKTLWGSSQYNDLDYAGRSRVQFLAGEIEHPDQLQRPTSLQIQLFLWQ